MHYLGRIISKDKEKKGYHLVQYDDGDLMSHDLSEEIVQMEEDVGTPMPPLSFYQRLDDEEEDDEMEMEMEEDDEEMDEDEEDEDEEGSSMWPKGALVQCLAPNSRWYRATVEAVRTKTNQYDILFERSQTKEKYVNEEREIEKEGE